MLKFGFIKTQKRCLEASCKVAYRITKEKKAHIIGDIGKTCTVDITKLVFSTEQKNTCGRPLSNDTISSGITDISNNILEQIMEELKSSPIIFSMQLDKSTDIS